MSQHLHCTLHAINRCLIVSLSICTAAWALEGGNIGTQPMWSKAPPVTQANAATRSKELADRKEAMLADIKRLEDRLKQKASPAQLKALNSEVARIRTYHGWCDKLKQAFPLASLDAFANKHDSFNSNLLDALKQFNADMKARGIDLIILPPPPKVAADLHRLVGDVDSKTEIWPAWTRMLIELLKNDIEIIDVMDAFRAQSGSPVPTLWINDGHTGPQGRRIFAEALANRLRRYEFATALQEKSKAFGYEEKEQTGTKMVTMLYNNAMLNERRWSKRRRGTPFPYDDPQAVDAGLRVKNRKHKGYLYVLPPLHASIVTELKNMTFKYYRVTGKANPAHYASLDVAFIGDSQLHTAVFGSGFPAILQAELNGLFRWGSKSWSGFSAPDIFNDVIPPSVPMPRVLIMTFLPGKFYGGKPYLPKPMPEVKNGKQVEANDTIPNTTFTATVQITGIPKRRDTDSLDYDEALNHYPAIITSGPHSGQKLGIRCWSIYDKELIDAAFAIKAGSTLRLTLTPWQEATKTFKGIGNHMVFNDSEQDLLVPVFWVTKGKLSPQSLKVP